MIRITGSLYRFISQCSLPLNFLTLLSIILMQIRLLVFAVTELKYKFQDLLLIILKILKMCSNALSYQRRVLLDVSVPAPSKSNVNHSNWSSTRRKYYYYVILMRHRRIQVGGTMDARPLLWGVLVFLKFGQFSLELQETESSGATESEVRIGNFNVKAWKTTDHKLHKMYPVYFQTKQKV